MSINNFKIYSLFYLYKSRRRAFFEVQAQGSTESHSDFNNSNDYVNIIAKVSPKSSHLPFLFLSSLILTHKRTITTAIHHRTQWLNHQSPPNFTPKPSDHHSNTISYQKIMADPQQSTLYMAPKTGRNKTAPSLNHGKTN